MSYADAAAAYRRNAILTASPEKIVKLLYDGAIQNLERSRIGLSDPSTSHSAEVGIALGKALSIIGELRTALDHDVGGEIVGFRVLVSQRDSPARRLIVQRVIFDLLRARRPDKEQETESDSGMTPPTDASAEEMHGDRARITWLAALSKPGEWS